MNFAFTEEQELIRDSARKFLAEHATSERARAVMESDSGYDEALWANIAQEMGWAAMVVPEAYGGLGLGMVELVILQEEMGRRLACAPFFATSALAGQAVLFQGNEDQKSDLLGRIAAGELSASLAFSEPSMGWNLEDINATWRQDGDGFVLNGVKRHVVDGLDTDLLIIAARKEGSKGCEGLSLFALEGTLDGMACTRLVTMDQTRPQAQIELNNVSVSGSACLGAPGTAADALDKTLNIAALALAAEQVGGAQECLDKTVEYVKERVQFGRPIGSFQAVKHKCADMMVEVESARSAVYYAACIVDEGTDELAEVASMAKAYCSDTYFKCAGDAIQLHGGIGVTWEHDAHLYFKRARASRSYLGDPAYHRERVAKAIEAFDTSVDHFKYGGTV